MADKIVLVPFLSACTFCGTCAVALEGLSCYQHEACDTLDMQLGRHATWDGQTSQQQAEQQHT